MADAVSCPATAITGTGPRPVEAASSGFSVPTTVPDGTMGRSMSVRMPSSSKSALLNWRVSWSIMPEVEASVYSHTAFPVSR